MDKTYSPQDIEQRWYQQWEQANYFQPNGEVSPYCIMLPPPNVTGSLHMGHGFQHTLMDTLIRYHRMQGNNTLWQGGVDHAGIATQIVVERQLEKENKTRHDLGREQFLEKVWQWKNESGGMISQQMRRMGSSIDWSRERFTKDAGFDAAVQHAFIQLYQEGLIYRGKRLVNWDPKLQSAVSDLEVIFQEEPGSLWHIRYCLNTKDYIVVATTRPETLFGDVAVAVNPTDERYKHLIGQHVKLPLTTRTIPIIADEYVDLAFGTGCVKITPAHDFNDYEVAKRHQLSMINILNKDGTLNHLTPFQNINRFEARKKLIAQLAQENLMENIEAYKVKTPRCERTGEIIEPFLTDQWYVNMKPLAEKAMKVIATGELTFIPENWTKTYLQWLENIQDWCISRQLWWGHRIPAYYDADGKVFVGGDYANRPDLTQDEDVLDTWFSAALWPFATLGWPQQSQDLAAFYPTSVLVTGFDIIFFWVARMVMFGLHFTGQVPFREVYITGLIRDHQGQKMSKSKGNVLDPIDLIDGISLDKLIQKRTYGLMNPKMEQSITQNTKQQFPEGIPAFGTDALRFTFCALANTGRDIRFDLGRVSGYRNFCNKIWNATRFVLINTEGQERHENSIKLSIADQWILSRLNTVIAQVQHHFADYRFDLLAQSLYDFFWNEYCDWYLELTKVTLNNPQISPEEKAATRFNLLYVLETSLRLLHPIMPFITEEIWQRVAPMSGKSGNTIQLQPFPIHDPALLNPTVEQQISWLQQISLAIRNIRSEMQVSPAKKVSVSLRNGNTQDKKLIADFAEWIKTLAKVESLHWLADNEQPPQSATAVVGDLQLFFPLADLINVEEEIVRLKREIAKLEIELEKSKIKLSNDSYVNKAPADVVAKERDRVAEWQAALSKLLQQLNTLQ
jgi:valyl-tRNA synthetase